ncbi:MAG: C-GCAxxG-C-C family protein [Lachnospiraceae bacterium]|nr:C-GCAxxG-C-C family protein [Lachnospiraceae bacterium]
MSEVLERSKELRNDHNVHYNCAQGVFIPFAERKGLTKEQAAGITANFGSGMRSGLTCGAITGGLMALGLYGADQPADSAEFFRRMRDLHEGRTSCHDLLAAEVHSPAEKKPHCDGMVYEAVEAVEEMLRERKIAY